MSELNSGPSPHPPSTSLRKYVGAGAGARPDDAQLCIDVRLALLRTCPTLGYGVEVSASDGVVHLRGSVGSVGTLVRMYRAARSVAGIHWVCNDVTVAART
jgi:osmotically-inducible protein OsmY